MLPTFITGSASGPVKGTWKGKAIKGLMGEKGRNTCLASSLRPHGGNLRLNYKNGTAHCIIKVKKAVER